MKRPAESAAFQTSTRRKPKRSRMGLALVFISIAPAAAANVRQPERNGVRPKPSWNSSGSRKGRAPMPRRNTNPPVTLARNVGIDRRLEIDDGEGDAPRVKDVDDDQRGAADDQSGDDRCRNGMPRPRTVSPKDRVESPIPEIRKPTTSSGQGFFLAHVSPMNSVASTMPRMPIGTFDPEDPAPSKIGGDEAAERRPEDRSEQGRDREIGERGHEFRLRHRAQEHEAADRHHHGAADPLDDP